MLRMDPISKKQMSGAPSYMGRLAVHAVQVFTNGTNAT